MKVAFVLESGVVGGLTVACMLICDQLVAMGHEVVLFFTSPNKLSGDLSLGSCSVNAVNPCLGIRSFRVRCQILLKSLDGFNAMIFAESPTAQCVCSALPDDVLVIKSIHNTLEGFDKRLFWNAPAIDVFVCVSPVVRELVNLRRTSRPVMVIPNGTKFEISKRRKRRKEQLVVAYVGRMSDKHKGVSLLPEIAKELKRRGMQVKWLIAGGGPGAEHDVVLNAFASGAYSYEFSEPNHEGVKSIMQDADFLIVPSRFEAFGLVLIEAMALGCLPVCSSAPAFSWILGNHSEDLQVLRDDPKAYGDIVERLLSDSYLYDQLQADLRIRQRSMFNQMSVGQAYDELLHKLSADERTVTRSRKISIPWTVRARNIKIIIIFLHGCYMACKKYIIRSSL